MKKTSVHQIHPLKAANENPWYVLMTMYDKTEQNQRTWNLWMTKALSEEERKSVGKKLGNVILDYERWVSIKDKVEARFQREWAQRNPDMDCPLLPDPTETIDFSETNFSKENPFNPEGMVFTKCSFRDSKFDQRSEFVNVIFQRAIDFDFVKFMQGVKFDSTIFESNVSFADTKFVGPSNFTEVVFSSKIENVIFSRAEFGCPEHENALIDRHIGTTRFINTTFNCPTLFLDTKFLHNLEFRHGISDENVKFSRSVFSCRAIFDRWKFNQYVNLEDVIFESEANFVDNRFEDNTYFYNATFKDKCLFAGGIFRRDVRFDKSRFNSHVYFRSVTFSGRAYFLKTEFGYPDSIEMCQADFSDSSFQQPANFRRAHFHINYPILSGTLLHEKSFFSSDPGLWPDVNKIEDKFHGHDKFSESTASPMSLARESCAVIRDCLTKQGLSEPAHFFFRREMRFTMEEATNLQKIPYGLYLILSDFGNSIWRPTAGLFIVFCIFWILFGELSPSVCPECPGALEHSFLNTVSLFGSVRQYFPDCPSDLRPILSSTQTIFSYILLFLLGLGLRQRFRLRS